MVARWLRVNYLEDNIDDKQLLLGVYMTVFSPFGGCQLSSALPGTCQDVCRSSVDAKNGLTLKDWTTDTKVDSEG